MNELERRWTPSFSPYARINQVPVELIFDAVRYLLFRWGFIGTFRADNGAPFGDPSRQALSPLHLHLVALGIRVRLNPPRTPTKNAKVERNQGTTSRWAIPANCSDYLELQAKLNQAVIDQRENYPTRTCQGQTRIMKYPELQHNIERFHPDDFCIHRLHEFLSKGCWRRKVSAQGVITLFTENYHVGYSHRGKPVNATLNWETQEWEFKDDRGQLLNSIPIKNLSQKSVFSFS